MRTVLATLGAALSLGGIAVASIAQSASPAAIGIAFQNQRNQVEVAEVLPGGTGHSMGVRPGDVITHANGRPLTFPSRFTVFVNGLKVGDAVELTVKRKGKSLQLKGTAMARKR